MTEVRPSAADEEYVTSGFLRSSNQVDLSTSTELVTVPDLPRPGRPQPVADLLPAGQGPDRPDRQHVPGRYRTAHRHFRSRRRSAGVDVRHPRPWPAGDHRFRRRRRPRPWWWTRWPVFPPPRPSRSAGRSGVSRAAPTSPKATSKPVLALTSIVNGGGQGRGAIRGKSDEMSVRAMFLPGVSAEVSPLYSRLGLRHRLGVTSALRPLASVPYLVVDQTIARNSTV